MKKALFWFLLIIPILLTFRAFLGVSPLAWGDAPFFYPEGLRELMTEPLAWTNRGVNFGGNNLLLWISPLMILYGILGSVFKLGNALTIRLIFYFPSLVLAVTGPIFLARYLKKSPVVQFFAGLVYALNTYYLLVVDGGQVGFALAYGIFPFAVLFLKKFIDKVDVDSFYLALILVLVNSLADPRVALIALLTVSVWKLAEIIYRREFKSIKNFLYLILLFICFLAVSSYWIVPFIKNQSWTLPVLAAGANLTIFNALTLFSPHWPANVFGQIVKPPPYFFILPLLILIPIFLKNRPKEYLALLVSYILFSLLTISSNLIIKIPLGFAFRDTSKLFMPVALCVGLLVGLTVETLNRRISTILIYVFILALVWQGIAGKMNFVLSQRQPNGDFQKIYENLNRDESFYRSLWIPERYPTALETKDKPALDGRTLVKSWPLGFLNAGEDPFNFLNNPAFVDWFRVLGIRYIIASDDPRVLGKTDEEKRNWNVILDLFGKTKDLEKVSWGINIPVHKISNSYPRFYSVKKVIGVIGQPIVNAYVPALNFEDGKLDPNRLLELNPNSIFLVFNKGTKGDLAMSFLQSYFVGVNDNEFSQWAVYPTADYLKYKYQLLIREVEFSDFDYSRGIAFSTKRGEKIEFEFEVPDSGEYVFASRGMVPGKDASLVWKYENLKLAKGLYKKDIENSSGFQILNVVALVPRKDFEQGKSLAEQLTKTFLTLNINNLSSLDFGYKSIDVDNWTTLKYKLTAPKDAYWIVFNDNYDIQWELRNGIAYSDSYPLYSMLNSFYVDPKWNDLEILFRGQENFRWGVYLSLVSGIFLAIMYLWRKTNNG